MAAGLDAASDAAEVPAEPAMDLGGAEAPVPEPAPEGGEVPAEEPAPEGGMPDMGGAPEGGEVAPEGDVAPEGGEEVPAEEPTDGEVPAGGEGEGKDEATKEIEKSLGKITNTLRKTELTDGQVKSYVNTFLSAFKDKFPDVEIEDRKAMAEKITKVVPDEEIEDLGQNVEDTEGTGLPEPEAEVAEGQCAECGSFAKYAESRGYNAQSVQECGEEEMSNLVSGYANAHGEGQNDGDFKAVALFITPEILSKLQGDYGHDEYAEKLTPYANSMNEVSAEDKAAQINELFGSFGAGMKNVFNKGTKAVGKAVGDAGTAIGKAATDVYNAGAQKVGDVKKGIENVAGQVKTAYHTGALSAEMKKANELGNNFAAQITALNDRLVKAKQTPLNVQSILTSVAGQIKGGGGVNIATTKAGKGIQTAEGLDPASVEVQPLEEIKVAQKAGKKLSATAPVKPITEEEEPEGEEIDVENGAGEEKAEIGFAPEAQSLGGALVKPDGAPTTGVDINISPDKSVSISMNETEVKLRKYVRNRLEEKAGIRKPKLNESKKSATLQKLDRVIDKQFQLFESTAKKKVNEGTVNEIFGFSIKEKFANLDPNNVQEVNKLFVDAFHDILVNPQMGAIGRAAKTTTLQQRYELLKQFVEQGGGTLRLSPDGRGVVFAPKAVQDKATLSQFRQGGTQGKTQMGGV